MIEAIIKQIPLLSEFAFDDLTINKLSGLTNKNYLIETPKQKLILRIPRKSTNNFINRNHESYNANIAQQLGIAPKTLWRGSNDLTGVSLTEFIDKATPPTLNDKAILEKLAKALVTIHRGKKTFKGTLDNHNIAIRLKQYFELCTTNQQHLLNDNYEKTLSLLAEPFYDRPAVSSHIDLVTENSLLKDGKLWIIDWEYSAMASPFWDIALICNSGKFDALQSEIFLKMVLENTQVKDLQRLNEYRFITKAVSDCWQAAFL